MAGKRFQRLGFKSSLGLRLPLTERAIMYAPLVGLVAGVGAIVFHILCLLVTDVALVRFVGYEQGGPANETEFELHAIDEFVPDEGLLADEKPPGGHDFRPWLLLIVPTVGGLISGFLVYRFAPEAEGHGTDSAIDAYHNKRGLIRPQVPIVKLFASAITIGTGGSGGREGPIAQIGAGFGSFLASKLKLSDHDRRILMSAGLGAGIGSIFHAPLAGAIFASEVLYSEPDFEAEPLIPAFISTTVAYSVFSVLSLAIFGEHAFVPLFEGLQEIKFTSPILLVPLTAMVLVMVPASFLYVKLFYGTHHAFRKLPIPAMFKPAVGAMLTGAVGLTAYFALAGLGPEAQHDSLSVLSFGYGFLQKVLDPSAASVPLLAVLLVVGLGKILTTSLTISSGGSGGVFGPSMVIGGALGLVVGLTVHHVAPGLVSQREMIVFAVLGMATFFAAAAKTPVSTLIMVSELTASYELLLPSMWVCALAFLLSRGWSIYQKQVPTLRDSPAHRGDFIIDVLEDIGVRDVLTDFHRQFITVPLDMSLNEVARLITNTTQSSYPVVDAQGHYYGLFSLNDIRQFLHESGLGDLAVAQDLATKGVEPLSTNMKLSDVIGRFARGRFEELPVVEEAEPEVVIAMLRRADAIALYDKRLIELRTEGV